MKKQTKKYIKEQIAKHTSLHRYFVLLNLFPVKFAKGDGDEFGVMDTSDLFSFLGGGMHGNQPCNSVDFFYCNFPVG